MFFLAFSIWGKRVPNPSAPACASRPACRSPPEAVCGAWARTTRVCLCRSTSGRSDSDLPRRGEQSTARGDAVEEAPCGDLCRAWRRRRESLSYYFHLPRPFLPRPAFLSRPCSGVSLLRRRVPGECDLLSARRWLATHEPGSTVRGRGGCSPGQWQRKGRAATAGKRWSCPPSAPPCRRVRAVGCTRTQHASCGAAARTGERKTRVGSGREESGAAQPSKVTSPSLAVCVAASVCGQDGRQTERAWATRDRTAGTSSARPCPTQQRPRPSAGSRSAFCLSSGSQPRCKKALSEKRRRSGQGAAMGGVRGRALCSPGSPLSLYGGAGDPRGAASTPSARRSVRRQSTRQRRLSSSQELRVRWPTPGGTAHQLPARRGHGEPSLWRAEESVRACRSLPASVALPRPVSTRPSALACPLGRTHAEAEGFGTEPQKFFKYFSVCSHANVTIQGPLRHRPLRHRNPSPNHRRRFRPPLPMIHRCPLPPLSRRGVGRAWLGARAAWLGRQSAPP